MEHDKPRKSPDAAHPRVCYVCPAELLFQETLSETQPVCVRLGVAKRWPRTTISTRSHEIAARGQGPGALLLDRASDVHSFALVATAERLRDVLTAQTSARESVVLRAIELAFHSDVVGAITVLRRALRICSEPTEAAYLTDILAQFLVSTGDFQSLARILQECTAVPRRLVPAMLAMNAILQAVLGDFAGSRTLAHRSTSSAEDADSPRTMGQVLCRCSIAAYYRGDYEESRDLALRAARLLESVGAFWCAAASYSVAATIAQDWNQDGLAAAAHYTRMLTLAEVAGHGALRRNALAARFCVAAEMFDKPTHAAMGRLLAMRPEPPQLQENYALVVAGALGFGWKGDFASAQAILIACAATPEVSEQQRALIEAFLALIAAANWDVDLARSRSRAALTRTACSKREPLFDRRIRVQARLLAAATCFIIGDTVRGQRALSGRYDAGHHYRELLASVSIDLSRCPELFRGYAEFINVASIHARTNRPQFGLTPAEANLLRILPQGSTLADLAFELDKSKHTIARQIENIYVKLGARNRAQAIQKAREAGLIS